MKPIDVMPFFSQTFYSTKNVWKRKKYPNQAWRYPLLLHTKLKIPLLQIFVETVNTGIYYSHNQVTVNYIKSAVWYKNSNLITYAPRQDQVNSVFVSFYVTGKSWLHFPKILWTSLICKGAAHYSQKIGRIPKLTKILPLHCTALMYYSFKCKSNNLYKFHWFFF